MLLRAAFALAQCVSDEQLNAAYIVPSVFDPSVPTAVAAAVRDAARPQPRVMGDRGME
jgi:malate dehydrogenase (oxaloacetate-decarboxylating)